MPDLKGFPVRKHLTWLAPSEACWFPPGNPHVLSLVQVGQTVQTAAKIAAATRVEEAAPRMGTIEPLAGFISNGSFSGTMGGRIWCHTPAVSMASSNDIFIETHRGSRELAWRTQRLRDRRTNHPQGSWWYGEEQYLGSQGGVAEYL